MAEPISRKLDWGWQCLSRILCRIMIRHSKEDIPEIPKPRYTVTLLDMNDDEKHSYNAVVSLAKANIVTTGRHTIRFGALRLMKHNRFGLHSKKWSAS